MTDLTALTIEEASAGIEAGEFDAVDLVESYLARIERLDGTLNCFITLTAGSARDAAAASAKRAAKAERLGPLDGIPVAVKDNIDIAGVPTTNGFGWGTSDMPEEDAEVIRNLKAAGAVLLGKLNMHEGALGATTDNPHHGRTQNPWRLGYTPGGSSGGSGAAVAARLCAAALGAETMGSVRLPAAYCGVVGLKPPYGLVSQKGLHLLAEAHDTIGPLARTVRDTALMLSAMTGDQISGGRSLAVEPFPDLNEIAIGRVANFSQIAVAADVDSVFDKAMAKCGVLGTRVREIEAENYIPTKARLAGLIVSEVEGWERFERMMAEHPDAFSDMFRGFLEFGRDVSRDRFEQAGADWRRVGRAFSKILGEVDLIASPTAPQTAFSFDVEVPANQADFTAPANFSGAPAISIPIGLSAEGLPVGCQLMAQTGKESKLLAAAAAVEANLPPTACPETVATDR